jgi:shikimate dehydrogenase
MSSNTRSNRPRRLVLLGDPVAHSLSPVFQNAALEAAGIPLRYEALAVPASELASVAERLFREGAAGNVTVPHKRAFLRICSTVTALAERVGAVNTFWTSDGKLFGDNTDVGGFGAAALSLLNGRVEGLTIALIGVGGGAAAVLGAAERWPNARVNIFSRRQSAARELAARFGAFARVETSARSAAFGARLVVNATPVGMTDDAMPFQLDELERGSVVMDLVYRKGGTALVRAARKAGITAADGGEMLLEQGALSFERWFGFAPDRDVMRTALG